MTELQKQEGKKFDAGKPPVWQGVCEYFPRALELIAVVSDFGASKYDWGNWKHLEDGYKRYSDGLMRHLLEEAKNVGYDEESNLPHQAHAAWNALARLELMLMQMENDLGEER